MGIWDVVKTGVNAVVPATAFVPGLQSDAARAIGGALSDDPAAEEERKRRAMLYGQAEAASGFAGQGQGNYQWGTEQGRNALGMLQRQAQGHESVSAEQLRQALGQNQAQQMSMAAGASPQNAAMAARTAAIQSGRLGAGLAGQQALAGLAERNQAQQQYGALLQGLRGQDLQATLGARAQAIGAYGPQNVGTPEKSWLEKYGPMIQSGASLAAAFSDRRLKTGIRDGERDAMKALGKLRAQSFEYKNQKHGDGRRVGVMAQDLERAGLGHAVIETPHGKAVHGGHLATSLAAMMPGLARRLTALEKKAA